MIDPMVYGIILNQDEDFTNLMELREMTEVGILRLAVSKRTEEDLAMLQQKLQAMEEIAAREGDIVDDLFQADNDFHDTVSLLCKNPQADKINRVVRVLTHAVRYDTVKTMVTTGRQEELIQAHREIYEVLRDRNTEGLEKIIRDTYFLNISGQ